MLSSLPRTTMTIRKPPLKGYSQGTRSSSEICTQAPRRHDGQGLILSSLPPQPRQNCWGTRRGYTSTTSNGRLQVMTGPLRWWALPNFAWYGLLPLVLLSPLTQATECECMRGSGRTRYFQSFTHMPSKCYAGKSPYTCTSVHAPGRTFWMSDLTERYSHPCDTYPKTGKVCWTYLAQIGLSDGGGGPGPGRP